MIRLGKQHPERDDRYKAPGLTGTAYRLILLRIVAPFLALLAAIDVVLFLVFKHWLGRCYGVLCLF